jgi:predicted choloylglycine hydrolase
MYLARLKGTYYEIGYQQGEMMKRRVLPPIWADSLQGTVNSKRAKFASECEEIVRLLMPEFLDELRGVSNGVGVDYDKVKIWPLCSYARLQQSCSAVAVSGEHTAGGKPLFIRNYDFLDTDGKDFTVFCTTPSNGYSSVGFSDAMSGRYCGFNEKGLAVGSSISGYAGPTQPGITFSLATRWILDHYSTTNEAVKFLGEVPHFHGWNFLLCDSQSNILRVETSPERVEVIGFDEGIGVSTNHYLSERMREFEEKDWRSKGSSVKRHANVLNWFQNRSGLITTTYACELAKSRVEEGGLSDRFVGAKGGTLWSWIYEIGERKALISDGPPCKCAYQTMNVVWE